MDIAIRIAGEAGQGVQTTGAALVEVFARMGLYVFATRSYWSRIRGGLNWYDVRIADRELFSGRPHCDLLVALTPFALEKLRGQSGEGAVVLFDGEKADDGVAALAFTKTARELVSSKVMANTVAAGAVFGVLGYDIDALVDYLEVAFSGKGEETVEKNITCARRGAEMAREADLGMGAVPEPVKSPSSVYSGSEAVGLSAAVAGVKAVFAYPMTPSTAAFTWLAGAADKYGIVVEQAEDEIAAANMACGATYAGVPAMVTTSGGGFALMVEGLSLAGMLELPLFIMNAQRPGPATGLPTRTGQEDLQFVIRAGHGEFARAVYAPGTVEEAYKITRIALETAHRYQTPVIMLSDQFLADMQKNIRRLGEKIDPIDRHVLKSPPEDYVRYEPVEGGVSARALPGSSAFVVVDSDEHDYAGHITEDLDIRVRMVDKRLSKGAGLYDEALAPSFYGPKSAKHLLVCWGSTYGPLREAVDITNSRGGSTAMVHFSQVWPVNIEKARRALRVRRRDNRSSRRVTLIEANATGQFASLLREAGVLSECGLVTRFDGLPFTGEELAERIR